MSEPYLGEVRCVGFNFAPKSWADATATSSRSRRTPLCFLYWVPNTVETAESPSRCQICKAGSPLARVRAGD